MGLRTKASSTFALLSLFPLLLLTSCGDAGGSSVPVQARRFDAAFFDEIPLPHIAYAEPPADPTGPARVISLIPSMTETIFALGLGEQLVGRSHWCDWPPEVRKLPDLGRRNAISKERIVDLRPDLVILFKSQGELARSLRRDFGLRILQPGTIGMEEALAGMVQVAAALGCPERGRKLENHIRRHLDETRRTCASLPRPRVLMVLDRSSWWVPGRTSFVHTLIEIAGGINVAAALDTDRPFPSTTLEQVMSWDPEVIIDLSVGSRREASLADARRFWRGLSGIRAVKDGRVHLLSAGVLTRPGPRMGAVAARLAEVIHDRP